MSPAPAVLTLHKVWCYPVQFVSPAPRLPPVEYMADKEQTYVRYNGERLLINTVYLQKLVSDMMSTNFNNSVINNFYLFYRNNYIGTAVLKTKKWKISWPEFGAY